MDVDRISVQLWTVRDELERDAAATLRRLAKIGYRNVEPYNLDAAQTTLPKLIADHGLKAPTAHQDLMTTSTAELLQMARSAHVGTFIHPLVRADAWRTPQDAEKLAAMLNSVANTVRGEGIDIAYHNHWWEFNTYRGRRLYDVFVDALDPNVKLQPDTYWVEVGGVSAPALVASLGTRVTSLHIKDGPINKVDEEHVAVGQGAMPIADLLSAALPETLLVVELDGYRSEDLFEPLQTSFTFLTAS